MSATTTTETTDSDSTDATASMADALPDRCERTGCSNPLEEYRMGTDGYGHARWVCEECDETAAPTERPPTLLERLLGVLP